ncbi:uncharacterized protein LOC129306060 [Prosopis cineraria]|uniref:uncharacterized protein LOC129306060 n=1 Tax=Prosopis cineraria TaxID=364024 RepID=UPI00240F0E71|nr:uncharacterized protein LOC129306060 [Prosopis cineraria]XP_054802368.1 uncharacterized protein LOC129306060 [Prosopis cineraria]XP_054802369.1 uncharacterized protein LOC129306060 [Prosopis cineraria]XP_054802370.1 uncharacterized protein LOC129306060 [Prosopis cineraria]
MVSSLKAKSRRSASVKINYLIHIEEIKPWPPSQSLRSVRSVLIQWENGERYSGSTSHVVPSLGSDTEEGKIEFNESFRLPVTLLRDMSIRGGHADIFQKNCLEFNLYEPRRDKTLKGQSLATAIIDLADYGILKETLSISAPMNCKRNYKNTDQPLLLIKIQPIEKSRTGSLSRVSLSKVVSKDVNGGDLTLTNEEYAKESEIATFSDDDVSSHSSVAAVASALEGNRRIPAELVETGSTQNTSGDDKEHLARLEKSNMMPQDTCQKLERSSSSTSSLEMSSDLGSPVNGHASSNSTDCNSVTTQKHVVTQNACSYPSLAHDKFEADFKIKTRNGDSKHSDEEVHEKVVNHRNIVTDVQMYNQNSGSVNCDVSEVIDKFNGMYEESANTENEKSAAQGVNDHALLSSSSYPLGTANIIKSERLKHVKSVRSPADSVRIAGSLGSYHNLDVKEIGNVGDAQNTGEKIRTIDKKDAKIYPKEARMIILDSKVEHLENKIKMLEGELREVAAIEASLYSVVAEHGSSMSKVHAPARRLSRLYLHACKENLRARRAGAAKNAVSGLVLVAKACGNDVPRLTFWLSNIIVLRTIVCQTSKEMVQSVFAESSVKRKSEGERNGKTTNSLRWKGSSPGENENTAPELRGFGNWDEPHVFTSALEKVEAWIFSRIVESIWWQTLIPHMQPDAIATKKDVNSASRRSYRRMSSSCDQEQGNISLDIWKNAFRESWDRLCPIRAGGHECGCLPVLSRLIMEQCVTRLDVAMFNAILRESADEIPSDPVSDPISDPKVLPIQPGQLSFGAGAQLKTAIGNWSRWLTDLFGMDDDDSSEDKDDSHDNDGRQNTSLKSFHLLNAFSDLLMLPKDLLLSSSVRREVCPKFSAPLIKRILDNFVADEFCPDPIPTVVFEALDSQDDLECGKECVGTFPCNAAPIEYLPPPATSIVTIFGEVGSESQLRRSRSSALRKAYTSDDELDELNSPLSSILIDASASSVSSTKLCWKTKEIRNGSTVRYELLRDVWMSSE